MLETSLKGARRARAAACIMEVLIQIVIEVVIEVVMQRLLAGWLVGWWAGGLAQCNIPNWLETSSGARSARAFQACP